MRAEREESGLQSSRSYYNGQDTLLKLSMFAPTDDRNMFTISEAYSTLADFLWEISIAR